MPVRTPDRHRERVTLLPLEALAADDGMAAAFGDVIDGAGGVPMRPRLEAVRQKLQPAAERRQNFAAGGRIGIAEQVAVERIGIAAGCEDIERRAGCGPAITPDRRMRLRWRGQTAG